MARKIRVSKRRLIFFQRPAECGRALAVVILGLQTILRISGYEANKEIFMKRRWVQRTRLRAYPKILSEAPEKSGCLLAEARAN
jgi:hypothetical protein